MFQEQFSLFSLVQMHLKTSHDILVLELIGDSCSRQRVGSVHYQFKLPVQHYSEILSRKKYDEYKFKKI